MGVLLYWCDADRGRGGVQDRQIWGTYIWGECVVMLPAPDLSSDLMFPGDGVWTSTGARVSGSIGKMEWGNGRAVFFCSFTFAAGCRLSLTWLRSESCNRHCGAVASCETGYSRPILCVESLSFV
jgi:hypothetical protein